MSSSEDEQIIQDRLFICEVQSISDSIPKSRDTSQYSLFISRAKNLENVRHEFIELNNEIIKLSLRLNSKGTLLQTKWKSLKDNSGSGASKNNYIHFNRLFFIKGTTPGKERRSHFGNDNETVANNNENDNDEIPPPYRPTAKKVKPNPSDDKFIKVLEKSMEQRHIEFTELAKKTQEVSDEDKLFFLSLVNEVKKIPEYKRLRAEIDIYNLISQRQSSGSSPLAFNYLPENYWYSPQYSSSAHGYTNSGRDIAPATPSSVTTSSEDSQLELFTDC